MRITGEQMRAMLVEIANERPDYVYEPPEGFGGACVYVHNGEPSCIIGHALARFGVPLDDVELLDYMPNYDGDLPEEKDSAFVGDAHFSNTLTKRGVYLDVSALNIAEAVQALQDSFTSWGAAVERSLK